MDSFYIVLSSVLSCVMIFPRTNVAQISRDQHWILHLFVQNQFILGYKLQRRSRLGWLWAQISKHLSRVLISKHLVGTPSSITKKSLCVCLSKKCSWGTCMCRINSTLCCLHLCNLSTCGLVINLSNICEKKISWRRLSYRADI